MLSTVVLLDSNAVKSSMCALSCFLSKPQARVHFGERRATSAVLSAFARLLQLACSGASLPEAKP